MSREEEKNISPILQSGSWPLARAKRIDGYLKAAGVALAAGCAMLPFIVYWDRAEPTPPQNSTQNNIQDPLDRSKQTIFRRMNPFAPSETAAARPELDPNPTGATMSNGKGQPRAAGTEDASPEDQPFPEKPVFLLREVVGGMAMIEDGAGYWFVEKGSLLPDGSTLVAVSRSEGAGTWQLKTSSGDVIEQTE
ncbi:hypothetical protein ATN84_13970 [Paramesorhizobium deserti]|uniref:Flagellar protein n=1 Tax=Paramesorhizobium deserti TaxID=1494590 RepID=A0A135HS55_9HYPH|nr:hypothetical protein [Paramesorhizobium deserti]KXF76028.1 hypothetical protein ATN84_13970 [Paramesorhizobium deserti]